MKTIENILNSSDTDFSVGIAAITGLGLVIGLNIRAYYKVKNYLHSVKHYGTKEDRKKALDLIERGATDMQQESSYMNHIGRYGVNKAIKAYKKKNHMIYKGKPVPQTNA